MLTNKLKIVFECTQQGPEASVCIRDRNNTIVDSLTFVDNTCQPILVDIPFPNRLFIDVIVPSGASISLKEISLSNLQLTKEILDQICNFQANGSESIVITKTWYQSGTIFIDFFAQDWVQYHLLYGNVINKK